MDEMKIVSKFTTSMISKLLRMMLRKKLGYDVDIKLNEVTAKVDNGKTHIHLDVDAELEKDELTKILKKYWFMIIGKRGQYTSRFLFYAKITSCIMKRRS